MQEIISWIMNNPLLAVPIVAIICAAYVGIRKYLKNKRR